MVQKENETDKTKHKSFVWIAIKPWKIKMLKVIYFKHILELQGTLIHMDTITAVSNL